MSGKIISVILLSCAILAGAGLYYLQVFHYYERLPSEGAQVTAMARDGAPRPLPISGFEAIDADSSPIRYRACFDTSLSLEVAVQTFEPYGGRTAPRRAPWWFGCFDADALGAQISAGQAQVFTSLRNLEFGIDRVVAITADGRGYIWHEVNECGDKAYDGSPLGKDCPDRSAN